MYKAFTARLFFCRHIAKSNCFMKKILMLLFFISCFCIKTKAQQFIVTGSVVDEYGRTLSGVSIKAKKSKASAESGKNGAFSILVQPNDALMFSYADYQTLTTEVSDSNLVIIAKITRNYFSQNDKVDVLYERKDASKILGSVNSIYTNQLTSTPASLYAYALAGRLPGLYAQQTRGWESTNNTGLLQQDVDGLYYPSNSKGLKGPNDNTEINLTLRGQTPVTIVDGVQRDIYTIDPENIESVSVLKDALSTILLGQRSSRGVVLVTTKKPVSGKPHISFTAQSGIFRIPVARLEAGRAALETAGSDTR